MASHCFYRLPYLEMLFLFQSKTTRTIVKTLRIPFCEKEKVSVICTSKLNLSIQCCHLWLCSVCNWMLNFGYIGSQLTEFLSWTHWNLKRYLNTSFTHNGFFTLKFYGLLPKAWSRLGFCALGYASFTLCDSDYNKKWSVLTWECKNSRFLWSKDFCCTGWNSYSSTGNKITCHCRA